MEWVKIEMMDKLSVHDEHWAIESEDGKYQATGVYSCGELVDVLDKEEVKQC